MKDPLQRKETPYDILDLPMDASPAEINRAMPKVIKKRTRNLQQVQVALRSIKNIKSRIEVDIFYYALSDIENKRQPILDVDVNDFLEMPTIGIEDAFTDLDKKDFSDEFMEIRFREFDMSSCRYDDLEDSRMDIIFDK